MRREVRGEVAAGRTPLTREVQAAVVAGEDPASEKSQGIAGRWRELIHGFTGGNSEIQAGLNRMYADKANWPASMTRPFGDDVQAFIAQAMRQGK